MGFERVAEGGEFVDLGENSLPFLLGWNEDNYGANFSNTKALSTQTTVFIYFRHKKEQYHSYLECYIHDFAVLSNPMKTVYPITDARTTKKARA